MEMAYAMAPGNRRGKLRRIFFAFRSNLPPLPHRATTGPPKPYEIRVCGDFRLRKLGWGNGGATELLGQLQPPALATPPEMRTRPSSRVGRYGVSVSAGDADAVVRSNFPDSGHWNERGRTAGIAPLRSFMVEQLLATFGT